MPATDQRFANGCQGRSPSLGMTAVKGPNPYSKDKVVWRLSLTQDEILSRNLAKFETAGCNFSS